jgi:tetratricopeptide (TPR) repeat protein
VKYGKGEWDGAIDDYTKAIQIDSHYAEFYRSRGLILYWKKNDATRALDDFNRLIVLNPTDVDAYVTRGNIWFTKDNQTRALADYNNAIELKPDDASAFNERGYLKEMKMQDLAGAFADYSKAVELNPKRCGQPSCNSPW